MRMGMITHTYVETNTSYDAFVFERCDRVMRKYDLVPGVPNFRTDRNDNCIMFPGSHYDVGHPKFQTMIPS